MKAYDLGAKAIIFSQFVNMLDVSDLSTFFSSPLSLHFPFPFLSPSFSLHLSLFSFLSSPFSFPFFSSCFLSVFLTFRLSLPPQLLEYRLQRGGIQCSKLLGHMNVDQRDTVSAAKPDTDYMILMMWHCNVAVKERELCFWGVFEDEYDGWNTNLPLPFISVSTSASLFLFLFFLLLQFPSPTHLSLSHHCHIESAPLQVIKNFKEDPAVKVHITAYTSCHSLYVLPPSLFVYFFFAIFVTHTHSLTVLHSVF